MTLKTGVITAKHLASPSYKSIIFYNTLFKSVKIFQNTTIFTIFLIK